MENDPLKFKPKPNQLTSKTKKSSEDGLYKAPVTFSDDLKEEKKTKRIRKTQRQSKTNRNDEIY